MSARRTWDKEFFEKKAKERLEHGDEYVDGTAKDGDARPKQALREEFRPADANAAGPMGSQRAFLKAREGNLDLEDKVGKVEIINPSGADGSRAGFWCEVCQCLLKDSAAYLDHINGKKHQRALGFSMRVERADVDTVKQKLEELKRKLNTQAAPKLSAVEEYKRKLEEKEAEKQEFKKRRKEEVQAKKESKAAEEAEEDAEEDAADVANLMGFKGFSSSKR
eukprot:gene28502-34410_t